jgi:hypothetical protein
MTNPINFNAENLIQSQSPVAPFMVIFESDDEVSIIYAVHPQEAQPNIVDQLVLDTVMDPQEMVIRWNAAGDRAGIISNERLCIVMDFKNHVTYSDQLVPPFETTWRRQVFEFSNELAVEFALDQFFKQPPLDAAVDALVVDGSQTHRLLFYKALLTSKLFVPITTQTPDDPNTLIYTFPNDTDNDLSTQGSLICSYTNANVFDQQMGQHGLGVQKIAADFLCFQAQTFDDILGITVTSSNQNTVLLTRDELTLLALISQPQRLDSQALLASLGDVFFDDVMTDDRLWITNYYNAHIQHHSQVKASYFCKPNVPSAKPLFFLVLTSTESSETVAALVSQLKSSKLQSICDPHIVSQSDIVAKALAQSKIPL